MNTKHFVLFMRSHPWPFHAKWWTSLWRHICMLLSKVQTSTFIWRSNRLLNIFKQIFNIIKLYFSLHFNWHNSCSSISFWFSQQDSFFPVQETQVFIKHADAYGATINYIPAWMYFVAINNTFRTITGLFHSKHKSLFIMQMIYMKILSVGYLNTRTMLYIRSSLALPLIICCLNMPSPYHTTFYCLFEILKNKY